MIRVSLGLSFVLDANVVWRHEIEGALDRHVGPDRMSARRLGSVTYVTDIFGSFGLATPKLKVHRHGQDVTESFLDEHPDRTSVFKDAEDSLPNSLAKSVLGEVTRTDLWSTFIERSLVPHYNKAIESYHGMRLDIRDRFLRRLASVIALMRLKDTQALATACMTRGKLAREVVRDGMDPYGNNITNVIPSLDAFVMLTMALIKRGRIITRNDLQDARHLAATVPYADIVLTDKEMASLVGPSGLASKARAAVLVSTAQLLRTLSKST